MEKENKMGTMPVQKLLLRVALPIIISMTIQGLYNVVDSIFVARINEDAINAVSLAFPVQNIMISVSVGLSVGMNAILSRSLGEKNHKKVTDTAMNTLFLTAMISVATFLFGIFGVKPYFASQTDLAPIVAYGEEYLLICCTGAFGLYFSITLERTLQATGQTMYSMISQMVGALVNILFDAIFIFGYLGFPAMEVKGAALATILGQTVSLLLNIYFNAKFNPEIKWKWQGFRPNWQINKEIFAIAIPSMAMGSTGSVLIYYLNQILLDLSTTATAVIGVYYKLQSFVFMPVYGLNNGMIPILAYNYGARSYKRFMQTLAYSLTYGMAIMISGTIVFQLFPEQLFSLFQGADSKEEMLLLGIEAVKIISFSFPMAGFCIMGSAVFQALGRGGYSLSTTIIRQIIIQLPCAYLLAHYFGISGVWYSFLVAETSAIFFILLFSASLYKKLILPMKSQE